MKNVKCFYILDDFSEVIVSQFFAFNDQIALRSFSKYLEKLPEGSEKTDFSLVCYSHFDCPDSYSELKSVCDSVQAVFFDGE